MASYQIAIPDSPDTVTTVVLEGVSYDIRMQWNGRDESWQLYLARQNQPFIIKTKVATGRDVLQPYRMKDDCPKGMILFVDNNKKWGRMTRDAFSSGRWSMYYITSDTREYIEKFNNNDLDIEAVTAAYDDDRFTIGS